MKTYYNEFNPYAAAALRQLISDGVIAEGDVDERSITEVKADDLKGYTQCHFFAGIGGWSIALRKAGWSDERPVWTGSCPCQPFSSAGGKRGKEDERHLWPIWNKLVSECRPAIILGEQVDKGILHGWMDEVATDLESKKYAFASAVLSSDCAEGDHERKRLWFVAQSEEYYDTRGCEKIQEQNERQASERQEKWLSEFGRANGTKFVTLDDGFKRRIPEVQPQICLLVDALSRQSDIEHLIGNAIDIEVASRFIKAVM